MEEIAHYELLEELGVGGMATVYRAADSRLGRKVALKVLHPHLRGTAEAKQRFDREAKSIASLRHPNIIEIYDYSGESAGLEYIATELLTGPTLGSFIDERGVMLPEVAAAIGVQIASALEAAHQAGVVHRDVKPDNILIHRNETVKLTDFGIAHMADANSFTMTGQVLGSPHHMSPEHLEGGGVDGRSDLFSLGTVLYRLVVGRLPFEGDNTHQVLARVSRAECREPMRANAAIGDMFDGILRQSMAKKPEDRFTSAGAMREALQAFLSAHGVADAATLLRDYFHSPDAEETRQATRSQECLLNRARDAYQRADHRTLSSSAGRVLAMDPGNPGAVAVLEADERRSRRKKYLHVAALSVLVASGAALIFLYLLPRSHPPRQNGTPRSGMRQASKKPTKSRESGAVLRGATNMRRASAPDPVPADRESQRPLARNEAKASPLRLRSTKKNTRGTAENSVSVSKVAAVRSGSRETRSGAREVVFQIYPQNVRIGVDGANPKPFGPAFRSVRVVPGNHAFAFVSGSPCCEDQQIQKGIPRGSGPYFLRHRLPYRPARIYVRSRVPADVVVGKNRARGRSREVLLVPMDNQLSKSHAVTVSADGFDVFRTVVTLRAGVLSELSAELRPNAPAGS